MHICTNTALEEWRPNFSSSGQSDPKWIRAMVEGVALSNCLNWAEWDENPVQVILCDACGFKGCESGGYIHASNLRSTVLWTAPQLNDPDDWEQTHYETIYAVHKCGAVVIPPQEWQRWRTIVSELPAPDRLPPTNGRALADAWRMTPLGMTRVSELSRIVPMLEDRLLGADTLDNKTAITQMGRIVNWLEENLQNEVAGSLITPESGNVIVETLYFDGPREGDWPAFGLGSDNRIVLAFGKDLVFVPEVNIARQL